MRVRLLALLAICLLIAAEPKDDKGAKDLKSLEGTWKLVAAEREGEKAPEDMLKNSSLTIKGGKYEAKLGDDTHEGKLKLDPTKKPKTLDATESSDQTLLGIYELKGDEFKVCLAEPGKDRPKEFSAAQGSGQMILVWKRASK
jgi:uncharacterized protein (TIGR03067 family)